MGHLRHEWIEALESGRFPQSIGRLKDGEARCAVGVGLEILRDQGAELENLPGQGPELDLANLVSIVNAMMKLPSHMGLTERQCSLVANMNHRLHMSHGEIARVLRQLDSAEAMIAAEHDPAAWEARAARKQSEEASPQD
jgi:hypothetical protein